MKIKKLLDAPKYRDGYVIETGKGFFGFYASPFREIEEKDLIPMPGYICEGKMAEEAPDYLLRFYGLEKE